MSAPRKILAANLACGVLLVGSLPYVGMRAASADPVFFKKVCTWDDEDGCVDVPPPKGLASKAKAQLEAAASTKPDSEMVAKREACEFDSMDLPKVTVGQDAMAVLGGGKIKHIVVLMQENRSFDHYLSQINEFKKSTSAPANTRTNINGPQQADYTADVPTDTSPGFSAFHKAPLMCTTDLAHEWWAIHYGWNYGAMDKFMEATEGYHASGTPDYTKSGEDKTPPSGIDTKEVPVFSKWYGFLQSYDNGLDRIQYLLSKQYDGYEESVPWNAFKAAYKAAYANPEIRKYGTVSSKTSIKNYMDSGAPAMQYFDQTQLPFYYELAATFPIGDRYFSSVLGPTFVNRDYLYGASSWGLTYNYEVTVSGLVFQKSAMQARSEFLKPDTGLDHLPASIYDQLAINGITTKTYVSHSISYKSMARYASFGGVKGGYHDQGIDAFFKDAKQGRLPQVAFIDADIEEVSALGEDEHPSGDVQVGQHLTWEIVRAVMTSPQWKDTALIITYDENGGFYDHVVPPRACRPDEAPVQYAGNFAKVDKAWQDGASTRPRFADQFDFYGVRVPVIVVSPWAKPGGYVSHRVYDHTSIVRFIQAVHGLPALTRRDANADPMSDFFDFSESDGKLLEYPAGFELDEDLSIDEEDSFVLNPMTGVPAYARPYPKTERMKGTSWTGANANYTAKPFPEPTIDLGQYVLCAMFFNHGKNYKAYSEAPDFPPLPSSTANYPGDE